MQNNTQYIEEDKIDLRELFSILKKQKKLISVVTLLFTLLALVYVFIAKPVYQVKTMIEVGQIDEKPIDNINNIQQKLSYVYKVNVKGNKMKLPRVKSISVPKKSTSIISVIIHGNNNEEAVKYVEAMIDNIETAYREKTNAFTNNQKELISFIQEDIKYNNNDVEQMQEALDTYSQKIISLKSEDAALAGIYALQIGQKHTELQNIKKYISELKTKEQKLKLSITPFRIKPTQIVGEIETLNQPIQPKKRLIVIIAFITGLMISVFLAFFLEFISRIKKEKTQENKI